MTRLTLGDLRARAFRELKAKGIETAALDARLLAGHAVGKPASFVFTHPEAEVSAAEAVAFEATLRQRLGHRPMSHILGEKEFWSLPFRVTPATLTPRPETETVIEAALEWLGDGGCGDAGYVNAGYGDVGRDKPLSVLDLGTGTGCLLLAILSELPAATGLGVDLSPAALAVARENAGRLKLSGRATFLESDWFTALSEKRFDLVLSNPPYIAEADREGLAPDVRDHEPAAALFAGADGLDAYRVLAEGAGAHLNPSGAMFVEVGAGQADAVTSLFECGGMSMVTRSPDLAGHVRCLGFAPGSRARATP